MMSLLVAVVLLVVAGVIFNILLETAATRRVLGRRASTGEGDATGAVLMASDYGDNWTSDDRRSFDAGGWDAGDYGAGSDAGDCGSGSDAGGGGDCGGGGGD